MTEKRLQIAIQKSGRLSEKSMKLLEQAGLIFDVGQSELFSPCRNFPLDVVFLRDDDIPEYVNDGICDLGIVGENVLLEKTLALESRSSEKEKVRIISSIRLGFGKCRLSLAVPNGLVFNDVSDLNQKRVATSYPFILKNFAKNNNIDLKIIEISGSVEITPTLKIADLICDLVSTGNTLRSNGLKEVKTILESQSIIIKSQKDYDQQTLHHISTLEKRIEGVLKAAQSKYIMMNAPKSAIERIKKVLPGMEGPTLIELANNLNMVAIHAVSQENIFWETMEELKKAGASSILVLPIEKIID